MTATDKRLDPAGTKDNPFVGRTDTTPRSAHDGPFGLGGHESLKRDQAKWDFAKAWDDEGKEHRAHFLAELDAKKRTEEQARRGRGAGDGRNPQTLLPGGPPGE